MTDTDTKTPKTPTNIKSFKVYCLPLSKSKQKRLLEMVTEYQKIYNFAAKYQPSLPEKYRERTNPSELYTKWIKSKVLERTVLGGLEAFNAIKDACSNYKASGNVSLMNIPNIVKFENGRYTILKVRDHYGILLGTRKKGLYLPLRTGKWKELINHLNDIIRTDKNPGAITYNFRDNSVSIPIKTKSEKFKKVKEIKTIIGVNLGVNYTAVFTAISVKDMDEIKKISSQLHEKGQKYISLKDVPVKILKVKILSGFETKAKMKRLKLLENKRRRLRKKVGHKRTNLRNSSNHKVSSELVKFASRFENPLVIFEKDLASLVNKKGSFAIWSPADVKLKTEYKLKSKGIWTFDIYTAHTATLCNNCGAIGIRDKHNRSNFYCPECGLGSGSTPEGIVGQYNASVNSSINIALRGLYVLTRPSQAENSYGHRDGNVEEPNARPDDNAQEVRTPDIREALDGKSITGIASNASCKDRPPVCVRSHSTSVLNETNLSRNSRGRNSLQVTEQPTARVSRVNRKGGLRPRK